MLSYAERTEGCGVGGCSPLSGEVVLWLSTWPKPSPLSFAAEVESLLDFLLADALVEPQVADTR